MVNSSLLTPDNIYYLRNFYLTKIFSITSIIRYLFRYESNVSRTCLIGLGSVTNSQNLATILTNKVFIFKL